MGKGRLEAFSDGVMAIIITIMVLELKVPHGVTLDALAPLGPVFLSYALSFVNLGIYWNNHHHMLHTCDKVNGKILWLNLHLLFWLSLVPFTTGWMGENSFAPVPTALYGVVLLMAAFAYLFLQRAIVAKGGEKSRLAQAVGADIKGKISTLLYILAIPLAFVSQWIAGGLYVAVALIWFIPDRRIESTFGEWLPAPAHPLLNRSLRFCYDDAQRTSRRHYLFYPEASGGEQFAIFLLCSFATAGNCQHEQIYPFAGHKLRCLRNELLEENKASARFHRLPYPAEEGHGIRLGPIVNDPSQDIRIGPSRHALEKIPADRLQPIMSDRLLHHLRLVEQDATAGRMRFKNVQQQTANPTADIGNDRESTPIVRRRHFGRVMLAYQAHRFIEDGTGFRIAAVKLPEVTSKYLIEGRVASLDAAAQARPALVHASTDGELRPRPSPLAVRNILAQAFAGRGIGEDHGGDLRKYAQTFKCT